MGLRSAKSLFALLWMGLAAPASATEVYMNVGHGLSRRIKLGIAPPVVEGEPAGAARSVSLPAVIRADLEATGFLDLIPVPDSSTFSRDEQFSDQDRDEAVRRGMEVLVKARWKLSGDSGDLDARLYDVASGDKLTGRHARAPEGQWRALAHRFADEVVRQFTGREGIAHSRIAFINDSTGQKELYAVDSDGHGSVRLTTHKSICLLPRWSPDGRLLSYTCYADRNPDLLVYELGSGASRGLSLRHGLNTAASWSPDGKLLALTLSHEGDPELYLIRPDGKMVRRLTKSRGVDTSPSWSPNGREIAFTSDRSGTPQIYVMDVDGAAVRRMTSGGYNDSPAWSPDGGSIAFARREDVRFDLYTVSPQGGPLTRLTGGQGSNENPAWSPDARFLAFTSTRSGRPELYVMRADGSEPHRLLDLPGRTTTPTWSP